MYFAMALPARTYIYSVGHNFCLQDIVESISPSFPKVSVHANQEKESSLIIVKVKVEGHWAFK